MKKVVAIGGGSGLSTLLRGLRDYPLDITAIVTMTDDGASTGRLRNDLKILPPGDIRKCLAALSEDESVLVDLFQHRFKNGFGLKGHSFGNLLISALKEMTGNFENAIELCSRLLSIKGKVLPASLADVHLQAVFTDDKKVIGESYITKYGYKHKIKEISLTKKVKANPKAIEAIKNADIIIVGPGSLYTSLLPNFLISEIASEYNKSEATKIFVCNISTERGETEKFSLNDHLKVLEKYNICPELCLVNSAQIPEGIGDGHIHPVRVDLTENIILAPILDKKNPLFHDSESLGKEIWNITLKLKKLQKAKLY